MIKSITQSRKATAAMAAKPRAMRVCADCGYKDASPVPPAMCPHCHNNPESPLAPKNALQVMNRHARRKQAVEQRKLQERVNKQLARERKDGPIVSE